MFSLLMLFLDLVKFYPLRSIVGSGATVILSIFELIGISALLPIVTILNGSNDNQSVLQRFIVSFFDAISVTYSLQNVLILAMFLGAFVVILRGFTTFIYASLVASWRKEFVAMIVDAIRDARWSSIEDEGRHSLFSAIQTEATFAAQVLSNCVSLIGNGIAFLLFCGACALVSWEATFALGIGGAAILFFLTPLFRKISKIGQGIATTNRKIKQSILEFLSSHKMLRSMNVSEMAEDYINRLTVNYCQRTVQQAAYPMLISSIVEIGLLAGVLFSIWMMSSKMGQPVEEIILLLALFSRLTPRLLVTQQSVSLMLSNFPSFSVLAGTVKRLKSNIKTRAEAKSANISEIADGVELRHVCLTLGQKRVLDNVSVKFPARQLTVLLGPSGGGKSTILDCLTGLRIPEQGQILVDGGDLNAFSIENWRSQIAIVPQEQHFFRSSIRSNFLIYAATANDDDMWSALEEADATDFVKRHPSGLDAELGDEGLNLSGGQRQRLSIARALLRKPLLLLLDEPTSALDAESEEKIRDTICKLKTKYTVVAVTHRPALADIADNTFLVDSGKVTSK